MVLSHYFCHKNLQMKKLVILLGAFLLCLSCQTEKTGYVDTEKLLTDYTELKEANDRFTKQSEAIQSDLEMKIKAYQIKEDLFRKNGPSMSRKKQEEKYNELSAEAQQLQQERQAKLGKLQVDSQATIDSLITKVKDKVKAYGSANGYGYIYGSNDAGSVLYGKKELDLTGTILDELNAAYKSSNKE